MADEKQPAISEQKPNPTTSEAMKELEEGKGKRFADAEELFEDIGA